MTIIGKIGAEILLTGITGLDVDNVWTIIQQPLGSNAVLTEAVNPENINFVGDTLGNHKVRHWWRNEDQWGEITEGEEIIDITLEINDAITQTHTLEPSLSLSCNLNHCCTLCLALEDFR